MREFENTIDDEPCLILVTYFEPYRPAKLTGHPDTWCPEEGGELEWTVLDVEGNPAPELEKRLTERETMRIHNETYDRMSGTA